MKAELLQLAPVLVAAIGAVAYVLLSPELFRSGRTLVGFTEI